MSMQTKVSLAIGSAVVLVIGVLFAVSRGGDAAAPEAATTPQQESALVRDDSHVLGEEGSGGVTFVEFLDFECEACGAAFPVVEDLRRQYAGEVTFVMRYFPLPGHVNSERAARAVESASRQGELEAMYTRLYETQPSWGESQQPMDGLFRSFAEDLGLDLDQYDADYGSPEVAARVQKDVQDGIDLGVQGTPTFYLDGQPFQPRTVEDFSTAIDAALAE